MENHLPKLIVDLALILGAGAITTIIFKKIKQPLVLGYIIAGFLVGPHFNLMPNVGDMANIKTWAEIGVIFLLFSLGLEFSFKKLINVGGAASITAIVEIVVIMILGYLVGQWMGWSMMNSIFLGGLLASSSTTIILRAFDELGVKRKNYARIVFGVLIVEDIVVILLMVLLSTMAVTQQFNGPDMFMEFLKLIFFLSLWFIFGIFLIPTLLRKTKKILDEETLLILSIGLCLGMVVLATNIGFSAELGAFVMGSILAETTSAEKIEHSLKPVKDLFGAVFFVSIGMMIDPISMYEYRWEILIVTLLTIIGKFLFTTMGALLSGQPLKQSVQVGMSMAQIGEFAFIVAALGMSLGVTSDFLFPIAVGVSAITTFTTPYMIKYSESFYEIISKIVPPRILRLIDKYSAGTQNIQEENKWKKLSKAYLSLVLTNGVVIIGIVLLVVYVAIPIINEQLLGVRIFNPSLFNIIATVVTIILCTPFLWAIVVKKPEKEIFTHIWKENIYARGPLIAMEIAKVAVAIILLGFILNLFLSGIIASLIVIPIVIVGLYFLSTKFDFFYSLITKRFVYNLNERDIKQKELEKSENIKPKKSYLLWDSHITDFEVSPNSKFVGKKLSELAWREKFGINIAYIKRGDIKISIPSENDRVFPYDKLGLIGTDEQIKNFEINIQTECSQDENINSLKQNVSLNKFAILEDSPVLNKDVKFLRDLTQGLVVGIERGDDKIVNPSSHTLLQLYDRVWIVADKENLQGINTTDTENKD
ncbi:sodium:proton antiporter [Apibacter muscae]|uniref:cation:proton antiporter n=1 Tax=Apibacter muscae TaxID=2509004 RepID=UPI0011AD0018|nr:cation:proton antiporter [Apibacter muscae]TWP24066.1 sodium:proton antiporter [Apibacter muscae]